MEVPSDWPKIPILEASTFGWDWTKSRILDNSDFNFEREVSLKSPSLSPQPEKSNLNTNIPISERLFAISSNIPDSSLLALKPWAKITVGYDFCFIEGIVFIPTSFSSYLLKIDTFVSIILYC